MFLRLGGSLAVAIAFAVPLVVLLATVRTSVGFWDTGDLQTVAWVAGIPYPTGYPLYVVVGWLWTHAIPVASVAARLNALSAVAVAGGAATVCALALLFEVEATIAILAAWTFAFAHTIWYRGTYADAHPIGFAVAFLAITFAVRWVLRGEARSAFLAIVLGGAALAFDNTTVLMLIGGLILVVARRPPARVAVTALGVAALIVVVSYAYLPLRSAQVSAARLDPTLALGVPAGRPFWDDHHPSTVPGFLKLVAGTDWAAGSTLAKIVAPESIRKAHDRFAPRIAEDFPLALGFVALLGIAFLARSRAAIVLGLAIAALLPALFGGSYRAEADPERYVFMLFALTAFGIAFAADRTVRVVVPQRAALARGIAVGLLALAVLADLWHGTDLLEMRDNREAVALGTLVVAGTRDDAVVVVPWDWATPLAYRAYVERAFGRRIVLCGFPEDYLDDYARWLPERQIAIVADVEPLLLGYKTRRLRDGHPAVYELVHQ